MEFFKKIFSGNSGNDGKKHHKFSAGDIFYSQANGQYHIYKLLVNDTRFNCYHLLAYKPTETIPDKNKITNLEVQIYHFPMDKSGFENPVFLVNQKVIADDLIGYHEYLRQTQQIENYVPVANEYYQRGHRLTDEKKYTEAIDYYSKAIDLIPSFFEAIDNRAFCKMDLGLWEDAIKDFELSLSINPDTLLAEFSIGECYFKMGDYDRAKKQFEMAQQIDPNHQGPKIFLKKIEEITNK